MRFVPGDPDPRTGGRAALPARGFTPFGGFPSPIAVPHHCGRCPPAVDDTLERLHLPYRSFPNGPFSAAPVHRPTSGPCSTDESVATRHRFQRPIARASHGLRSPPRYRRLRSGPVNRQAAPKRHLGPPGAASCTVRNRRDPSSGSPCSCERREPTEAPSARGVCPESVVVELPKRLHRPPWGF